MRMHSSGLVHCADVLCHSLPFEQQQHVRNFVRVLKSHSRDFFTLNRSYRSTYGARVDGDECITAPSVDLPLAYNGFDDVIS